jgi:pantoate--beta-alanine ligase
MSGEPVEIARTVAQVRHALDPVRRTSETIGFCPTMGALHDGHLSLVRKATAECDVVVASIFVNPKQFGPTEDLSTYPRNEAFDLKLLERAGCRLVFVPDVNEMYPEGFATSVSVHGLDDELCGRFRPGHFTGVATVVLKLFNIVKPHRAYFGIKDAQQLFVIERMVTDLNLGIEIRSCPIVREQDGLAMSSRNLRLTPESRREATAICKALRKVEEAFGRGERRSKTLKALFEKTLEDTTGRVEYVQVVTVPDLKPTEHIRKRVLVACAVLFGTVRLIDNTILEPPPEPDRSKDRHPEETVNHPCS